VRLELASAIRRLGNIAAAHLMLNSQSPDEQRTSFRAYLTLICTETHQSLGGERISLLINTDELALDTSRAINLALIASEALTNAMKYAFPDGRQGTIRVDCHHDREAATLTIADDPAFSASPFLTAKSVMVGVRLWPLIVSRSLNVTHIRIEQPVVTLSRNAAGRWNYASLATSSNTSGTFAIRKLELSDGQVLVGTGTQRRTYDHVNVAASDLSPGSRWPIAATAVLPGGGTFSLTGDVGPMDLTDATLTPLDSGTASSRASSNPTVTPLTTTEDPITGPSPNFTAGTSSLGVTEYPVGTGNLVWGIAVDERRGRIFFGTNANVGALEPPVGIPGDLYFPAAASVGVFPSMAWQRNACQVAGVKSASMRFIVRAITYSSCSGKRAASSNAITPPILCPITIGFSTPSSPHIQARSSANTAIV
jgi:hypothetical protein